MPSPSGHAGALRSRPRLAGAVRVGGGWETHLNPPGTLCFVSLREPCLLLWNPAEPAEQLPCRSRGAAEARTKPAPASWYAVGDPKLGSASDPAAYSHCFPSLSLFQKAATPSAYQGVRCKCSAFPQELSKRLLLSAPWWHFQGNVRSY